MGLSSIQRYYIDQIVDSANLEGNCAIEKLVGEDTYAPDVNFAVVGLFVDYLGRGVDRGAALGCSQQGGVDCPSKVAYLYCVLGRRGGTSCRRMFSGFRSRWIMS